MDHPSSSYDREAIDLSPYAERYYLAEGNRLLDARDSARASAAFQRIFQFNPGSADAFAGLGLAALQRGDLAAARAYDQQSRLHADHSTMLRSLETALRQVH